MNLIHSLEPSPSPAVAAAAESAIPQFPGVTPTFMGRDAFALLAHNLGLGAQDTVLLPAFSCPEVVRPFTRRAQAAFYDLGPDLAVDPELVRARLKAAPVKALVLINYFGFLQPHRAQIKEICESNGTWLVEDCAHSLLTEGSGQTGDAAVYSFRKIIPVPDGGGLRWNRPQPTHPPVGFHPKLYADSLSLAASLKSRLGLRGLNRQSVASVAGATLPRPQAAEKELRLLPMSSFAQRGLAAAGLWEIVRRRRADYQFWQEVAHNSPLGVPMFEALPAGVCPLGFPMLIKNREALYERARRRGIYLRVHWRLSPQAAEHRHSYRVAQLSITLPVYPELAAREREALAEILLSTH
ncbi:MAG TPA: DegT/DnrJ/EryC1/StrS family aminotransferase [Terriglobales bacterium]|nr:DegT/DnrJ/EryC1/StrS family aminotransferase [Terriglobales bacterium]